MEKRGISALISTVLIIGITIAAFALVYTFVIPMIRQGIDTSTLCSNTQLSVTTQKGYTCYDSASSTLNVQIARGPKNVSLSGIQVVYIQGGNSFTANLEEADGIIKPNNEKVYLIDYTESAFTEINYVSIAAVIKTGKKDFVCDLSPQAAVEPCS